MSVQVPLHWKLLPLEQVATLQRGFDLPVQERIPGSVPIFAANGPVGTHQVAKVVRPGVITGRSGSIGKVHFVDEDYWPLNTSLFVKDFHGNYPRFIFYLLQQMRLEQYHEGTGVPTLNRNNVHSVFVPVPPLSEQRRIAAILDKADELRAKQRVALRQLDGLTKAIFLDLFGDPVVNTKGWPLEKLGRIGTLDRGISKHRPRNAPELLGGPYPLVQTGDVANCDGYIRTYTGSYSELGLRQSKLWPAGTLCITIAANIAKTGILTFDSCFPDSIVGFIANDSATVEFVRIWLSFLQKMLEDNAPESAQKNINLAILRDLTIPLPPITLQHDFANCIAALEKLKASHRASFRELNELFGSLQHRAFRGEL